MFDIHCFFFSRSSFNYNYFSMFILNNFKVGFKYCLLFRIKCYDGCYLKPLPPVYIEVFGFNDSHSWESLFNYFYSVLKVIEDRDSSLLTDLYFMGGYDVIAIQFVEVGVNFDENNFEALSEKFLPLF